MDLTKRLRGKRIAYVASNGHVLSIQLEDNSRINIAWVDDDAHPIKGRPVIQTSGARLLAEGFRDLIYLPSGKQAGVS